MSNVSAEEVRSFILSPFLEPLKAKGFTPQDVSDDFDLLSEGIIDSLGILEMISALEEFLGLEIDLEDLDVEDLTVIGPFCRYVEQKIQNTNSELLLS